MLIVIFCTFNFSMTYHIVIFKKENAVEVVPSHWLSKDGITCAWPHRHLNPKKQIEKKINPNTSDFNWYDVRVLAKDIGKYKYSSEIVVNLQ